MAVEVYIPKFGQTVEEVTLLQWLVDDGVAVKKGQEILEIETDKTTFFVESEGAGTLHRGPFEPGAVVPVLTVVATIGAPGEKFVGGMIQGEDDTVTGKQGDTVTSPAPESVTVSPSHPVKVFASPRARKLAAAEHVDLAAVTPTGGGGVRVVEKDVQAYLASAPKASPLAEKIAAEAGIDLRKLTGTGAGGKITKEDVEAAVAERGGGAEGQGSRGAEERPTGFQPPVPSFQLPATDVAERIALKGVRGIIAERMGTSVHTTARVTLMLEADATEFVAARERLKAKVSEEWGFAPGYNDLLAKIVAAGLRKFPYMNARLAPDAIERLGHVNVGMAVDTERGLLVPVIRDADQKSLRQFGAEFREMVDRARKGRSLPDDISGGTFTITNLGMYDIEAFTPVINLPEAAILGVGKIAPKWVFRPESPDKPVLRQMMALSLVFDHRIIDGAPAAKFLQYIKQVVEEPYLLLAA
ncbi:MAG: 2-oxo acid dehydrogenase subunit E2 [Anaerolineae bacterium]|jgi:pyruvate dehydrogenase E2 component (dihydrolipoamide acetyltransferase)|nr:2-oxo acid dehydrogenase subunit E2 [Anaerolineae bacterium]